MNKNSQSQTDKILSISAIVIAVVSIIVSVWEGIETRKHNRLSVMPRLEIRYKRSSNSFGYVVINNGLGPAIIVSKKIFVDGEEIENSGFSGINDFLNKLNLKDRLIDQKSINPGHIIRAGDFQNLFYFTLSGIDD